MLHFYAPRMICDDRKVEPDHQITAILWTRFNVWTPKFQDKLEANGISRAAWLAAKKAHFTQRCLPSVAGQKDRFDRWYVLFDAESDETRDIEEMLAPLDWAEAVGVPRDEEMLAPVRRAVEARHGTTGGYLLSCRVDCDDALNRTYLRTLTTAARAWLEVEGDAALTRHPAVFFSFCYGIRMDPNHEFFAYIDPYNNCCARLEAFGGTPGITTGNHRRMFEMGHVEVVATRQPMWLQSIEAQNVSNSALSHTFRFTATPEVLRAFSIKG